jgi:phosphatidylglycerophosphatase C
VDRPVIAAFDVDGTLTHGDCVLPFLRRVAGRRRVGTTLVRCAPALLRARRDRARRDDAKARLVAGTLTGRPVAQVSGQGEVFAAAVAARHLRSDVVGRLRWHQRQGHEVVLVTASLGAYAEPLGRALGAARVLATELEVGPDGRLTGRLRGANCRGAEKVARLRAQYGEGLDVGWAYGDTSDDQPMLDLARHPVRVGAQLLQAAP